MNIEISSKEYEKQLNWDDAMMYCQLLTIDNKNDWRLPTKEELHYIYNYENDFVRGNYWSSDESDINCAWFVNFNNGIQYIMSKHIIYYRARPIRNIRLLERI